MQQTLRMKKLFFVPIVLWFLTGSLRVAEAQETRVLHHSKINAYDTYVVDVPGYQGFLFSMVVGVGSSSGNDVNLAGVAHFLEHQMTKGSKKYPQDLDVLIEERGGEYGAFTLPYATAYYGEFLDAEAMLSSIDLFGASFQEPLWDLEKMQEEREAILTESKMAQTDSARVYRHLFYNHFYGDKDIRSKMGVGVESEIMSIQMDQLKALFYGNYTPENTKLFLVGDFKKISASKRLIEKFKEQIENSFLLSKNRYKFLNFSSFPYADLNRKEPSHQWIEGSEKEILKVVDPRANGNLKISFPISREYIKNHSSEVRLLLELLNLNNSSSLYYQLAERSLIWDGKTTLARDGGSYMLSFSMNLTEEGKRRKEDVLIPLVLDYLASIENSQILPKYLDWANKNKLAPTNLAEIVDRFFGVSDLYINNPLAMSGFSRKELQASLRKRVWSGLFTGSQALISYTDSSFDENNLVNSRYLKESYMLLPIARDNLEKWNANFERRNKQELRFFVPSWSYQESIEIKHQNLEAPVQTKNYSNGDGLVVQNFLFPASQVRLDILVNMTQKQKLYLNFLLSQNRHKIDDFNDRVMAQYRSKVSFELQQNKLIVELYTESAHVWENLKEAIAFVSNLSVSDTDIESLKAILELSKKSRKYRKGLNGLLLFVKDPHQMSDLLEEVNQGPILAEDVNKAFDQIMRNTNFHIYSVGAMDWKRANDIVKNLRALNRKTLKRIDKEKRGDLFSEGVWFQSSQDLDLISTIRVYNGVDFASKEGAALVLFSKAVSGLILDKNRRQQNLGYSFGSSYYRCDSCIRLLIFGEVDSSEKNRKMLEGWQELVQELPGKSIPSDYIELIRKKILSDLSKKSENLDEAIESLVRNYGISRTGNTDRFQDYLTSITPEEVNKIGLQILMGTYKDYHLSSKEPVLCKDTVRLKY